MHNRYQTDSGYGDDIALIRLSKPAVLNQEVGLVCLPKQNQRVVVGKLCYLTGNLKILKKPCFYNLHEVLHQKEKYHKMLVLASDELQYLTLSLYRWFAVAPCWWTKQNKICSHSLHKNEINSEEKTVNVPIHQHGGHDVTCKPSIKSFI